jgi:hypothetical protein
VKNQAMSPFDLTPEEARALWVADLRSEKYKQGKGALHNFLRDEYCCLGVACRTFMSCGGILDVKEEKEGLILGISKTSYNSNTGVLPLVVREWLGLRFSNGSYKEQWGDRSLSADNDNGSSFLEIASIIEAGKVETVS